MNTEKKIRLQTKDYLKGNWVTAASGFFVLAASLFLVFAFEESFEYLFNIWTEDGALKSGSETVFTVIACVSVLAAILLSPFKNGFFKMCYNIVNDKEADLQDVFYFFKRNKYLTTLQFNLIMIIRIAFNFFIGLIPCIILNVLTFSFSVQLLPTVEANEIVFYINIVLIVLGVIYGIISSVKFFITEFLFIENDAEMSGVFSVSGKIIKSYRKSILKLFLGFLPWIALCFFVVPSIYVVPYLTSTFADSSKWLIKLYKEGKVI